MSLGGVRALIVARKRRNWRGAKGGRKVDARDPWLRMGNRRKCPKGLAPAERTLAESQGPNRGHGPRACWRPPRRGREEVAASSWSLGCSPDRSPSGHRPVPMRTPPTGEPDAGDPPVRFGGRGNRLSRFFLPLSLIVVGAVADRESSKVLIHVFFFASSVSPLASRLSFQFRIVFLFPLAFQVPGH